ncbi:hypothetical protein ACM66B_005002 [Microbotryomycetes sp. NB124-2]
MNGHTLSTEEPIASTSRAVYTLKYNPAATESARDDDPFSQDELWHELYTNAWTRANNRINLTLNSLHDAALDEIVDFVNSSDQSASSLLTALSGRVLLPTGLIVGASPSSAGLLFTALCRQLSESALEPASKRAGKQPEVPACLVSRLSARNCPNIKTALRVLNAGFINKSTLKAFDDDDGSNIAASSLKSATLPAEDLQNLLAWYTYRFRNQGFKGSAPRLVVLLEDLEGMQGHVLSALIETLAGYAGKLPLVFLIGVATSADAINQVIWRGVTSLMNISTFFVEPGIAAFNAVMRDLFVDTELPLSIGAKAFDRLSQDFAVAHLSVDATISAVQYLYMYHYASSTVSSFSPEAEPSRLSDDIADNLLQLDSVVSLACNEPLVTCLAQSPSHDLKQAQTLASEARHSWFRKRRVAFELLLALQRFWDKQQPMEKMLLALHDGTSAEFVDEVCKMTLHSASTKIPALVQELVDEMEALDEFVEEQDPISHVLTDAVKQLEHIASRPKPSGRQNLINRNVVGHEMISSGIKLDPVDVEFSNFVKEFADSLGRELKSSLKLATSVPLHECWLIQDASSIKHSFHPALLTSIQTSLSSLNPASTRSSNCDTTGLLDPPLDIAIAYKMYCETGRIVNLADWYTAWEGSVWDEQSSKKRKRGDEDGDGDERAGGEDGDEDAVTQRKQARFIRAIGDLGFLGFLQPTARKAEHVTKTVF